MSVAPVGLAEERCLFGQLVTPEFLNALAPPEPSTVYTPYLVVWLLVYQRLHGNASLNDAVCELLTHFPRRALPDCKRVRDDSLSANTGAYRRARSRLDPDVASAASDRVAQTLLDATPPAWKQRRVFLLDGTTLQLAHTPELCEDFPPARNQNGVSHWPILHLVVAHELSSGLALAPEFGPMYGPKADSELALALRVVPRLPAAAVILADRNFGVFALACAARSSGRDVVVRLTEPRFRMLLRKATPAGGGRWSLTWHPSRWDRTSHPELAPDAQVNGWLVEVRVSDALTLWLFSTLDGAGGELAELYRRRVDVETDIRDVKQTLSMERLSGRSRAMAEKELVLGVLGYNLVNQVRRLAAQQAQVEPRRLSFAGTWSLVKGLLAVVSEGLSEPDCQQRFEQLLRWAAQRKLPRRPSQRSYPRTIIPRRTPFPKRRPTVPSKPESK
jgi:hypothetical protein